MYPQRLYMAGLVVAGVAACALHVHMAQSWGTAQVIQGRDDLKRAIMRRYPPDAASCSGGTKGADFAYVSILTCTRKLSVYYLQSSMKLVTSIREHSLPQDDFDAILLMGSCQGEDPASFALLEQAGWSLCHVPLIKGPSYVPESHNRFTSSGMFTKFHAWNLQRYSAVLFLDSDTMVLKPVMKYLRQSAQRMTANNQTLGAVPQHMTTCNPFTCLFYSSSDCPIAKDSKRGFNAGVMLIRPHWDTYRWLISSIENISFDVDWAEQGLLNAMYPPSSFEELDPRYNFLTFQNPCGRSQWEKMIGDINIIHFTHPKPWECDWTTALERSMFNTHETCELWKNAPLILNSSMPHN